MLIDRAKIYVKAGNGGNGNVSFHREKYISRGGPDGGDGGKGGSVSLKVDVNLRTLIDFKYKRKYIAENGKDGGKNNCSGKNGEDLIIYVPPGTIIRNEDTGAIIADLTKNGQEVKVAIGGKGGAGNQHFATATRQIPNFAKPGNKGTELMMKLELKLLADVGLIGYPNVGKSTLLSIISEAKPKIENYHFTTLEPNLGVVKMSGSNSFVVADIPGLIEGAHEGVGLGHDFLKHIERTKMLVHVIDISGSEGRSPIDDFKVINSELENFNSDLAKRKQIIAANKIDVVFEESVLEDFKKKMNDKGYEVFFISAATNKGINELINRLGQLVKELPDIILIEENEKEVVIEDNKSNEYTIRVEDGVYIIDGDWARRFVGSINIEDYDSLQYFQRVVKQRGIIEELEKLGVKDGDTVRVYDFDFDFIR